MSCNNCNDFPISCAPKAPGGDCCPKPQPPKPCPPPVIRPGTSQYIGARYVPMFADPVVWDNERAYEPLTIVVHNGDCYTSKCFVPVGADISNGLYWVKSQDYNYQFDQLKQVVADLSKQVTAFAGDNEKFTELINNFSTEFATMQTEFGKWSVQFPDMNGRLDAAEADIDTLQAADAETAKTIDGLKKTDSELARRLDGHDTDIAGLRAKDVEQDGRLDAIDAKNTQYDADIAALKAKDADQQTQLDTLKNKDAEQDTRLDGIDAKLAQNTKNIQDNATNIAANARELADHAEQLKDHDARLTAQQKEITENTSGIAGLRSDLTEDEAKIEANRDAIAHIQEKDVQQDGRLDALERRTTTAEGRLDGLDAKTDATNTALAEEVNRAKAAEQENGKLIAKNAAKLTDHETRITVLEGDNTTNKTEIANIKAKDTEQDTAIQQNRDAIADVTENLTGYVKTETYTTGQAAQDAKITAAKAAADKANTNIGGWETEHPGQTISECVTSQENELTEHAGSIAKLETDKADKTAIPDVSGFVTQTTYDAGQATQDGRLDALESAHHYANIEEAIKGKGYLNVVQSHAQYVYTPSTSSSLAAVTFASSLDLRVQLPPDAVVDDTKTVPTGKISVCPNFGFINSSGNYTTAPEYLSCSIMSARYYSATHTIQLTITQPERITFNARQDSPLLFWNYTAAYL
nr:MAG TPA: chromosome segregation ATPase [Caudoviricetes sp.]